LILPEVVRQGVSRRPRERVIVSTSRLDGCGEKEKR